MKDDILRKVSYEIDKFEMDHYNEDKKGRWEGANEDLDKINDIVNDLQTLKHINPDHIADKIQVSLANARCEVDNMESIAVQNGLVRSNIYKTYYKQLDLETLKIVVIGVILMWIMFK